MSTVAIVILAVVIGIGVIVVVAVVGAQAGQRRGYSGLGGQTIVRCSKGHLFTTLWVVGSSLKAVRLGDRRIQRCPVCEAWRIVAPVPDVELTEDDRRTAAAHHDTSLP
jgi:hypothetical protein